MGFERTRIRKPIEYDPAKDCPMCHVRVGTGSCEHSPEYIQQVIKGANETNAALDIKTAIQRQFPVPKMGKGRFHL